MTESILHPHPNTEPDLYARDIGFGRGGLSVGIVEDPADAATVREMLSVALAQLATLTATVRRQDAIIEALRGELRGLRLDRAA